MASESSLPSDLVQLRPGLGILRLAALFAEARGDFDEESLDSMFELMEAGVLEETPPAEMWPELMRGLMAPAPSRMIVALRESAALPIVLPEVAALFGVPQLADNSVGTVDIGYHLLNALSEAARGNAPLEVRFALLVMNVGKFDSPSEHLPVHYRHIERGQPRIDAICDRFGAPDSCRVLAQLALAECERVHRASEVRAGPIAAMLERLHAFDDREAFNRLMTVCICDYRSYEENFGKDYPKAAMLDKAVRACDDEVDDTLEPDEVGSAEAMDAIRTARAAAIAKVLRSVRWTDG
jgi:tRNA nucleotidyltransferase (CCA-adding enzyme)